MQDQSTATAHDPPTPQNGFLRRMVIAATVIFAPVYLAGIAAYYGARALGYTNFWLVDLTGYILPWVLLPAAVFLPGALWRRSRLLLAAATLPLLAFAITYAPLGLPNLPPRHSEPTFRLMSYNVLVPNTDYGSIMSSIRQHDPDIVALQEVSNNLAQKLENDWGQTYPYQRFEIRGPGQLYWGQAILSRYPILEYRAVLLGGDDRPNKVQYALMEVPGGRFGLVNVHLFSPGLIVEQSDLLRMNLPTGMAVELRERDMAALLQAIEGWPNPLILAGDFNLPDQSPWYRPLRERLVDAHRESGWGLGFTRTPYPGWDFPWWRIDYVFHTPDMVALRAVNGDFGGSDHRPVVVELAFRRSTDGGQGNGEAGCVSLEDC